MLLLIRTAYNVTPKACDTPALSSLKKFVHILIRNRRIDKIKPSTRNFVWSSILLNSESNNKNNLPSDADVKGISKEDKDKNANVLKNAENKFAKKPSTEKLFAIKLQPKDPETNQTVVDVSLNDISIEDQNLAKKENLKIGETKLATQEPKHQVKTVVQESITPRRKRVDPTATSFDRNFVTPVKAMSDFLLKASDLEDLPKTRRRSPYENEPPITVFWRKDVEAKSLEIWGSAENLLKEKLRKAVERKEYHMNMFALKRQMKDAKKKFINQDRFQSKTGLESQSGKIVLVALAINFANLVMKIIVWYYTGSHSMFSECIHSLGDTGNQLILAYGIYKSNQLADAYHPYGYSNMRYVSSLVSGVAILCVGSGLSFYHGVVGFLYPTPIHDYFAAYLVLLGSLVSEGVTLSMALNSAKRTAKQLKMPLKKYILGGQEPSINVVLLEDMAAVLGVVVAGSSMALSVMLNNSVPDAVGSMIVGCLVGSIASFIVYTNGAALIGRSIPYENLEKINSELEGDVMIRAIHDVKGIDIGNFMVRYKAELDFDGRELTKMYLDKQDLKNLFQDVKKIENVDKLEEFMLKHGENIVDMMGGQIDRIEMKLRDAHPEIRHCDLEIL